MIDSLQHLFCEPAVLFKDKINFKVPGSEGFEPHQDLQVGWDRYARLQITMPLSIDATTPANECLQLAPHWHDRGMLGELWKPLGERVSEQAYVECPSSPGGVVFSTHSHRIVRRPIKPISRDGCCT